MYGKHENSFQNTNLEIKHWLLDFANNIAMCQLLYVIVIIHNNIVI